MVSKCWSLDWLNKGNFVKDQWTVLLVLGQWSVSENSLSPATSTERDTISWASASADSFSSAQYNIFLIATANCSKFQENDYEEKFQANLQYMQHCQDPIKETRERFFLVTSEEKINSFVVWI